jgi:hypothetical protein
MASIEQTRREAMGGKVGFFEIVGAALRSLTIQRAGLIEDAPARPLAECSELFARARHENSLSAMDWLYYAAQLRDEERHHCIVRAAQFAYGDEIVLKEIRRLSR